MAAKLRNRARSRRAVAGLEFALLAPVLMILLTGTTDVWTAFTTYRRLQAAAGFVAEIASTQAAQFVALNQLNDIQAWRATTAPFVLFPGWAGQLAVGTFAITLSEVSFTVSPAGCTQNCSYTPQVQWSVGNNLGQAQLRACGPLSVIPNGQLVSLQTLSAGNVGPTALLIADVSYTFKPLFFGFLTGAIPMQVTASFSPRVNNGVNLVPAGGIGFNRICPVSP